MIPAIAAINLWNPTNAAGFAIVATAFVLGMVHGVTPDEDTWPITFSCSIGGCSTRRGLRSGLTYSLAFTVQRAAASELAYLGLAHVFTFASVDYVVYLVVGSLMVAAGLVVHRRHIIPLHLLGRLHLPGLRSHPAGDEDTERPAALRGPRPWMPAAHGFVAGWGFGAFPLIIYTVLAPAEHSAAWGWVPGAFSGLGTMAVQILAGGLFGLVAARRGLGPDAIRRVALRTAGNTLTWGGVAFVGGGAFGLAFPAAAGLNVATGLHVLDLDRLGIELILVVVSVFGVGVTTLVRQTQAEARAAAIGLSLRGTASWHAATPLRRATAQRPGSTPGSP
ncbi:MAG: hypothetical protein M0020_04545 [Actinomycetota bacterium]|nr:hypothetical protein [Actinomycetota bacterium]